MTIFTRLVDIDFSACDPSSSRGVMIWLISNAPSLKAIHLTESHFLPDVSNAMINMSHLSKLEITKIRGTAEFYDPITSFIRHHIAMEDQSTLEEFSLHINDGITHAAAWLNLISQMNHLKDLKLLAGVFPEYFLPVLQKIGRGCPSLESLTLGNAYYRDANFTDGVIRSLCEHPKLRYLKSSSQVIISRRLFRFVQVS
ncbi:predicted protein [Lichtheimia corymbifera JMRC:FSU:9682]|uniref:F-box domain-containing protein n=1 Tax=Lichtheimia corymbifera JMRC:FSU:9682 TaxID=1263082 RepID=A0A068RYI4_9FUNG|nr:predicted protein [Lichtheimia corymbifera JMRC:FSU:9682]